jgi:Uma2 family endonuclease
MANAAQKVQSYEEYLELEAVSLEKHEFFDGFVVAMAGGTPEHALIGANVIRALGNLLGPGGCNVFGSDLRVRAAGLATYPDVTVICGRIEVDPADRLAATNPSLLVEVLSPSTEAYDLGQKFSFYRSVPTLRTYIVIRQDQRLVQVFTLQDDGAWRVHFVQDGEAELPGWGVSLSIDEVYRGLSVTTDPPAPPPDRGGPAASG